MVRKIKKIKSKKKKELTFKEAMEEQTKRNLEEWKHPFKNALKGLGIFSIVYALGGGFED